MDKHLYGNGSSTFRPTTILNNVSDDTSPSLGGNLSTGSNNISGSGTIDLQGSGNKLKFNFANSGSFPNSTTYEGMFATAVNTNKASMQRLQVGLLYYQKTIV